MAKSDVITIKRLSREDCAVIAVAFNSQNWNKPAELFETYFAQCSTGKRHVLIAEVANEFAGMS